MGIKFTNNATTVLASGINSSVTSLTVTAGQGALFPSLGGSDYFYCTLANTIGTVEIIKVTARSTDTFTIVRAQDNTLAASWLAGDKVELRLVAATLNNLPKLDEANTFTAAQTFSAGSAAAPAITTSGDTNTGIFFPAADTIAFSEGGTEAARFDSSGRLLVGTTSSIGTTSVGKLQVLGGETFITTNSEVGGFVGVNSNSDNSVAIVADPDSLRSGSHIVFYVDGFSEKARIDSSGNLLVSATSVPGAGSATTGAAFGSGGYVSVQRSGSTPCFFGRSNDGEVMALYSGTTQRGQVSISGATTTYASFSDYRLKENIVPLTGAIAKVMILKPSTFNFIEFPEQTINGFVAHEVAEVEPIAVTGQKDAVDENGKHVYQSVDPAKLVPLLTAAIQELNAKFEAYKATHP
jgi:hypothetical protein